MPRRLPVLALVAALSSQLAAPSAADAQPQAPRIVVLTVDGTSIEDWLAADAFKTGGALALLAARTGTDSREAVVLRESAYASLGAGEAAEILPRRRPTDAGSGVLAGALGEALARRGLRSTFIGDASGTDGGDAPAVLAVMRADGSIASEPPGLPPAAARTWQPDSGAPTGRRTDYGALRIAVSRAITWASVVVVDLGDTARADRTFSRAPAARARWIARALADASRFARDVRAMLGEEDALIVASLVPPLTLVRAGAFLGAVTLPGPDGLAFSGTTRRPGVLSLTDLAPTILARADVPIPSEMGGRPARVERRRDPARELAALHTELVRARAARRPVTRVWLIAAAALALAALLTIVAGRGRAPVGERIPRRWRDWLATGLLAVAAAPAAMLLAPVLPGGSVAAIGWWTLGLSAGGAVAARVVLGSGALPALAAVNAFVVIADLVAGTPLALRSPLGFQIAGGGRFYGIDEGLLGVVLAASLVASGLVLDQVKDPRRMLRPMAVALAAVAVVAAAPSLGSKFGAPYTLVPAFGVFVVWALGRRIDRTAVVAVAIATVLLSGSLALADALAAPAARSHIGREITGGTSVGPLVGRKLASLVEITATTIWLPVVVVVTGTMGVLLVRRRDVVARGLWGMPGRRAALSAVLVGCACALVSNDTGIIVVAPAVVLASAAFYAPILSPPSPRRPR